MTLRPFSDTIDSKQETFQPVKGFEPGLEPFSVGIHQVAADTFGGPGSGNYKHKGRPGLEGGSLSTDGEVYTLRQKQKLLKIGLSDIQIKRLEKSWIEGPRKGFQRLSREEYLSSGSEKQRMCKAYLFVDIDKRTGMIDTEIFPEISE